ncbi:type II secretion system protein GspG, partial [bacterium]|nr:type II secretion system protein GspG [bacterium]
PSDPIVREIKKIMSSAGNSTPPMFKTSRIVNGKEMQADNSCWDYFNKIIVYLSSDESKLSSFLSADEIKEMRNNLGAGVEFPGFFLKNMGAYTYLFGKSIDEKLNPTLDAYFSRKYASCIYVLKKDAGVDFSKIAQLAKKCNFEKFGKRDTKQGPNIKIIKNEITDTTLKINLIDLFAILQKNYLDISGWNGPYIAIPKDNPWAYDYVFFEDGTKNIFGIMSTGPNMTFDNFGEIGEKDSGYLISLDDLQ